MSGEIKHEAIISTNLARQEISERLLQSPRTRIFVVEFNDLFESQVTECLGDRFGILNGAGNFRRQEIVLYPNDNGPRLVIQPFWLSQLGGRG